MPVRDLHQAYLFQGLSAKELAEAAEAAGERVLEAGEYVYRKGDPGTTLFLIAEGKVELIEEKPDGTSFVAGHISAGGHFGEVSLFTGKPRSLTVKTLRRTRFLTYDREQFRAILLANPLIHQALDRTLAERLSLASDSWSAPDRSPSSPAFSQVSSVPRRHSDRGAGETDVVGKVEFELARKIRNKIHHFAGQEGPVLLEGESGTGRRLVAKQIHLLSRRRSHPYVELDIRQSESWLWEEKLFGLKQDSFPYAAGRQLGILDQMNSGTLVLFHAEDLDPGMQRKIYQFFTRDSDSGPEGDTGESGARLIIITDRAPGNLQESMFIAEFAGMFAGSRFVLPPLREHKQDIKPLVDYYLHRYNAELNRRVTRISPDALNVLIKYDWPGNLTELSNVIHRAVMISPGEEILAEQIFLGLSGGEQKLSYNLLRLPRVRRIFAGNALPIIGRSMLVLFAAIILALFFGPQEATDNFGITLCWYIGWPLLIISFFFLPRFWCSVCALSAPGKLLQRVVRPVRRLPASAVENSGWIMALLCLAVFWVEIVFNAYDSPRLTGMILLAIALGALLFSLFFERYTWCRYICPLGALNALFSMPSILELRANRQMCINQCRDHVCYRGTDQSPGCPMYRHPFLVDNNKDCILCGRCIRNCQLRSIELNLRLAPRELWSLRSARLSDNFLIISLGTVFFFLAFHQRFLLFMQEGHHDLGDIFPGGPVVSGSLVFWGIIAAAWGCYLLLSRFQALLASLEYSQVRLFFGYGLIPLVLAGYLAYYTNLFITGAWKILPNFLLLFGVTAAIPEFHLLTPGGTATLLHIIIFGGFLCSLYAVYKIFQRMTDNRLSARHAALPFLFLLGFGWVYLAAV
ncbi:MAG: sigma 54-interacting transcriptional regulator [Desulfobulbaceae bacterium]|nr:sigma 54-interacting transcriptional regulator [Desulfobulbaceae bacterium]